MAPDSFTFPPTANNVILQDLCKGYNEKKITPRVLCYFGSVSE